MIDITVYQNENDEITGFCMTGHAGYAKSGKDIVCSAVSMLVINTINSIETYAPDQFDSKINDKKGLVDFNISSRPISSESQLLLKAMSLGLRGVYREYGDRYLQLKYKRKQEV